MACLNELFEAMKLFVMISYDEVIIIMELLNVIHNYFFTSDLETFKSFSVSNTIHLMSSS